MSAPGRSRSSGSAAAAVLAALAVHCGPGEEAGRASLVLITVDTLRPDRLGAHGHPAGTSPALDRLAAQGASFPTAIVPRGQTWPTLATILTSQYPVTHGVRKNGLPLSEDAQTLAHVLAEHGYRCAAALAHSARARWPGFHETFETRGDDFRAGEWAADWITNRGEEPFFLWLHLFSPHRPYDPPAVLARRFARGYAGRIDGSVEQVRRISERREELGPEDLRGLHGLYDGEVFRADGAAARVLRALDRRGLAGNTLVVFTADHGEELYERNAYISHSASVYDTVLRAPFVIRWPGKVPAGAIVPGIAEAIDVAPTALALLGLEAPESFRGRSLAGALRGERPMAPRAAFSELEDRVVSVRTERYRYVHNPTDFDFPLAGGDSAALYPIAREELYDHARDPGERVNRAGEEPEVVAALRAEVLRWQGEHAWDEASERLRGRDVPGEVREALDALGYLR